MTEELNRRHNLATTPTINNNGESYIVPFDIYKEGYDAYDISNWFKGRVGDNGTPFCIRWYAHGRLMNVQGYRPFIEGEVGDYTIDDGDPDNPQINMDPDASHVHIVGDVDDCQEAGIAVYRLINQAFPKSGIFYGKIGFMGSQDDGTLINTGVDVVFKVLAGHMSMLAARKFYVSELEKAIIEFKSKIKASEKDFQDTLDQHNQDFQKKTQQVIDDARNAYNTETKNAHDSLDALKSQIKANRDEQQNLSQHLAGTEQQIEIHDVVTRPEFLNLSNQLSQQVAQMKEAGLEFFNNADDLKAKYPQGANKLCVTLSDSHEWVYDYAHGQWTDAGAFNYGTIDPKLTKAIYQNNSDNLIPNSDFITQDYWHPGRAGNVEPNVYLSQSTTNNASNALVINGFIKDGTSNESWLRSEAIPIGPQKFISFGTEINVSGINTRVGDNAGVEIRWIKADGSSAVFDMTIPNSPDDQMHKWTQEQLEVPAGVVAFQMVFYLFGNGQIRIRRPQANFGEHLLPYSFQDSISKSNTISVPLRTMNTYTHGTSAKFINDDVNNTYLGKTTYTIDATGSNDESYNGVLSSPICVEPGSKVNLKVPIKATTGTVYFQIRQYTDPNWQGQIATDLQKFIVNSNRFELESADFTLDSRTNYVTVWIIIKGTGFVSIHTPVISYDLKRHYTVFDFEHLSKGTGANYRKDYSVLNGELPTLKIDSSGASASWNGILSKKTKVQSGSNLKFSIPIKTNTLDDGKTYFEVQEYANKNDTNPVNTVDLLINSDNIDHQQMLDVKLLSMTNYIVYGVINQNTAVTNVGNISFEQTNDLAVDDFSRSVNPPTGFKIDNQYFVGEFEGQDPVKLSWNVNMGNLFDTPAKTFSITTKAQASYKSDGQLFLEIQQFKDLTAKYDANLNIDLAIPNSAVMQEIRFEQIKLDPSTKYIKLAVSVHGNVKFKLDKVVIHAIPNLPKTNAASDLPQFTIKATSDTIADKAIIAPFEFTNGERKVTGYVSYAIQGNSSAQYPKKNLKLKFFEDPDGKKKMKWKPKADWDKNHKFNLKANWIDATQSRNLVNSKLVADAIKATPFQIANQAQLARSQNFGEMEGFPVELNFSDGYYGLMTFNTKKDDKPYGIDSDDPKQEALEIDTVFEYALGTPADTIDGKRLATIVQDQASDTLQSNFAKFQSFVKTASDDEFKAHIADYVDVKSAINCYLFGNLAREYDFPSKSIILLTYDEGKTFYFVPYDLDSTWGLYWNGSKINANEDVWSLDPTKPGNAITAINDPVIGSNSLFRRIYHTMKPVIQKQWNYLRTNVWRNDQLINAFKYHIDTIPEEAYERDQARWPDIPSKSITNFVQIQQAIIERGNAMDNFMEHLADSQPTSPAPAPNTEPTTPKTNNQPTSGTTPTNTEPTQPTTSQAQPTEPKQDKK